MITKEEFLKALDVISNYKKQISKDFEEMKKQIEDKNFLIMDITEDSLLKDINLSMRIINGLLRLTWHNDKFKHLEKVKFKEITIKHFSELKKDDLWVAGNIGKKSIDEIERCFYQAGIII